MIKKITVYFLIICFTMQSLSVASFAEVSEVSATPNISSIGFEAKTSYLTKKTNRFIIKYKGETAKGEVHAKLNSQIKEKKNINSRKFKNTEILVTKMATDVVTLKAELNDNEIEYIQPDTQLQACSSDPYYSSQTWLQATNGVDNYGINVASAWTGSQGTGVVIGLIDTGVDTSHEDISQNIWVNTSEIANNGIDDDNDGYIDNVNGWNFVADSNQIFNVSNPSDSNHGTHIAGTIVATKDNNKGIAGVAPMAKIMPLKVFENGIAYTSDIIEAIDYAEQKSVKIVNCSWGTHENNQALGEAIIMSDMLFICSAGNDGAYTGMSPVYPAAFNFSNIISVASVNAEGQLSSFSNYGDSDVLVSAPGEDIISTLSNNAYGNMSGTSVSAAFVTGEAALILSKTPSMFLGMVKETLIESSDRLTSLQNMVYQGSLINCDNAINGIMPGVTYDNAIVTPSPEPTIEPTPEPTASPTPIPTNSPIPTATPLPTAIPTHPPYSYSDGTNIILGNNGGMFANVVEETENNIDFVTVTVMLRGQAYLRVYQLGLNYDDTVMKPANKTDGTFIPDGDYRVPNGTTSGVFDCSTNLRTMDSSWGTYAILDSRSTATVKRFVYGHFVMSPTTYLSLAENDTLNLFKLYFRKLEGQSLTANTIRLDTSLAYRPKLIKGSFGIVGVEGIDNEKYKFQPLAFGISGLPSPTPAPTNSPTPIPTSTPSPHQRHPRHNHHPPLARLLDLNC